MYGTLIHTCSQQVAPSYNMLVPESMLSQDWQHCHGDPYDVSAAGHSCSRIGTAIQSDCWSLPSHLLPPCESVRSTHTQKLDVILAIHVMMHNSSSTQFLTHPTPVWAKPSLFSPKCHDCTLHSTAVRKKTRKISVSRWIVSATFIGLRFCYLPNK